MNRLLFLVAVLLAGAAGADEAVSQRQYLSGLGKDDGVAWEFFCTGGRNAGVWTNIAVPSCWETMGFGAYGYQVDPAGEQGKYRRGFTVPAEWRGRVVRVVFEGALTDTEVWINGKPAGPKHQGGFYPFAHDISGLVVFGGTNLIEATVAKVSGNAGVNAAERKGDYWNFGGIFRPVYLEALPASFIERVAIDARADGSFRMEVFPGGAGGADRVVARIEGLGEAFGAPVGTDARMVELSARVAGQRNWSAETPALYTVQVELQAKGRTIHRMAQRFGFRTFEVRAGEGLFLNGSRITLKGSCRHSFWPDSGRTTSPELSREDVRLMKEMNMNAVRMSHYPPDRHFLEVCDEQGLYVLDELAGWQHAYDTPVGRSLVEAMVKRDVNHPSILFWDNGNEGGFNFDLDGEYAKWDPQGRRVLHPWALHDDVLTSHYRPYSEVKEKCASGTIYLPTEFLHGLYDGGGGAGLDDYWSLLGNSRMGAGGFLWAFVDEGVVRTDKGGVLDNNVNRAPDGLLGPRREKEGSFFTVREIWCPVQIATRELAPDFDGALPVENRFDFTDLSACQFRWETVRFAGPGTAGPPQTTVAKGELPGPAVAPRKQGVLKLPLPADWRGADALKLTAVDPAGAPLWTWSWPTRRAGELASRLAVAGPGKAEIEQDAASVRVKAGGLSVRIGRQSGLVEEISSGGSALPLGAGPRFVLAGTKSVKDGKKTKTTPVDLARSNRLERIGHEVRDNAAVVTCAFTGGDLREIVWTVRPGGWMSMAYRLDTGATCELAGISFDVPETAVQSVRWLGRGPYRVWKNRLKGTELGVWTNRYNDTDPGKTYGYPEFKGYFGDWNWAEFGLADSRFTLVNATEGTYLGVFRPRDGESPMDTRLHVPETGIGVFHAIPPIGNKFSPPAVLGPQSQPNVLGGSLSGLVHFRFDPAR